MTQLLFINLNQSFLSRIKSESQQSALVTASMLQALRWITNPEMNISGIYLNPNDTTYSALRFLEISLLQRPATPIYLIDDDGELSGDKRTVLFESNHIRGTFRETEPYEFYVNALNLDLNPKLDAIHKRVPMKSEHVGYLAVPMIDFAHSRTYVFDVFVEDESKKLRLFATAGSPVEHEYLSHVSDKTSWLYVAESNVQEIRESIRSTQSGFITMDDFPVSWKTAEVLFNAKVLLNEMKKSGLNDTLVEQTHFVLSDVFYMMSHLSQGSQLAKFVDQAKNCDRTLACATMAILMCKSLKFEKNSIVEILGLASFFQDLALYQTPYGNLAEVRSKDLNPDAKAYYVQHPTLSADLVAQTTSIPDVTLQVMRQHHERKDRTGYPNRIGGMQLHPMAEVLSLINAYFDYDGQTDRLEQEVYTHYSDRIVVAFKSLLSVITHKKEDHHSNKLAA
ncbi:MAG: hypothetical protein JST80_01080 [Bdellovibrionales bacterium]|nr:hypothetical protein [Bdellovibrionales bacterium]